ncbi:MAG: hypothetical protein ACXQTP_00855 [Candidatus Methanofastidiosia archaeon]
MRKIFVVVLFVFLLPFVGAGEDAYIFGRDYWFTSDVTIKTANGWRYDIELMQSYELTGKVVGIQYYKQEELVFSPVDIGIVWGTVAKPKYEDCLTVFMYDRQLDYSWKSWDSSITADYLMSHISNNHAIPRTNDVFLALLTIKPGDYITIKGFLADVRGEKKAGNIIYSSRWGPSSTSWYDVGDGACEIVLIEEIAINGVVFQATEGNLPSQRENIIPQHETGDSSITPLPSEYPSFPVLKDAKSDFIHVMNLHDIGDVTCEDACTKSFVFTCSMIVGGENVPFFALLCLLFIAGILLTFCLLKIKR